MLRYLKGTIHLSLHIKSSSYLQLQGRSDADFSSNLDDRRSIGGYCVYLGHILISWSSKKQHVVSRSSCESEYLALSNLTAELLWIRSLLKEINYPQLNASIIWCDNLNAISLAYNPVLHAKTKHVELDVHFIIDKVQTKKLI